MIEVAVTVPLECAHRSPEGKLHGHSYLVEVWKPAGTDLRDLHESVLALSRTLDHELLEDRLPDGSMEAIAAWFLKMATASRVVVRRPTLGFVVEATA